MASICSRCLPLNNVVAEDHCRFFRVTNDLGCSWMPRRPFENRFSSPSSETFAVDPEETVSHRAANPDVAKNYNEPTSEKGR